MVKRSDSEIIPPATRGNSWPALPPFARFVETKHATLLKLNTSAMALMGGCRKATARTNVDQTKIALEMVDDGDMTFSNTRGGAQTSAGRFRGMVKAGIRYPVTLDDDDTGWLIIHLDRELETDDDTQ